jgi:hypothetical protein
MRASQNLDENKLLNHTDNTVLCARAALPCVANQKQEPQIRIALASDSVVNTGEQRMKLLC